LRLVCIFLGVLARPVCAEDGEKAAETFNALFGADLARVRKTGDSRDDAALAARLLETATKATDQPAFLALVCETVANLGLAHPDGYAAAAEAMELVARSVPEKAAACRERLIEIRQKQFDAARGDERQAAGEALLDCLLPVIEAKEKAGALAEAAALYRKARTIAAASGSPRADEIDARAAALAQRMKTAARIADVKALLARDPANVSAREGLVRIYLVDLDDPAEAAKHLKGAKDEALLKYVPAAAKGLEAAPEFACLELGEWYARLAAKAPPHAKAAMDARAKAYLERFLTMHTPKDLSRTRATLAFEKVQEAVAKLTAPPTQREPTKQAKPAGPQWIDLLAREGLLTRTGATVTQEGIRIGRLTTVQPVPVPFAAEFIAKTDSTNIRIAYGTGGLVIFNWEMNQSQLRIHDFATDERRGFSGKGKVPVNQWVQIVLTVTNTQTEVYVDGELRARVSGNYRGLSGPLSIRSSHGSVVTVKGFRVRRPQPAEP